MENFGPSPQVKAAFNLIQAQETWDEGRVKKRIKELLKRHHPDKGGDPEKTKAILAAKECLEKYYQVDRRQYEEELLKNEIRFKREKEERQRKAKAEREEELRQETARQGQMRRRRAEADQTRPEREREYKAFRMIRLVEDLRILVEENWELIQYWAWKIGLAAMVLFANGIFISGCFHSTNLLWAWIGFPLSLTVTGFLLFKAFSTREDQNQFERILQGTYSLVLLIMGFSLFF